MAVSPEQDRKLIDAMALMRGQSAARRHAILRRVMEEILTESTATSDRMIADYRNLIISIDIQNIQLMKAA